MTHPDIPAEQEYFDRAFELREKRRDSLQDRDAYDAVITPKLGHDYNEEIEAALASLGDVDEPVAFGRINDVTEEKLYIGRRAILDEELEPMVINWRAPAAERFYRATPSDPLDVSLKRIFQTEKNTIVDIVDHFLADVAPEMISVPRDVLLKSLEQHRDGRLRDIVETIERAQDEVMRAGVDQILVVQGGPGTGKTIIGLQRISVIRYLHSVPAEQVLFVGPTPAFIDYIGHVLPGLGDEKVAHRSVRQLSRLSVTQPERDDPEAGRVKGDVRMADLLRRAVEERHRAPTDRIEIHVGNQRVTLLAEEVAERLKRADNDRRPHNLARDLVREGLVRLVADKARSQPMSDPRTNRDLMNLLDRVWPTLTARQVLRDLYASKRLLQELGGNLFDEAELSLLFRPQQQRLDLEPWTLADVALADELDEIIRGEQGRSSFEVAIVDEAQDLSPMQLRMIARRCTTGRITVLGDLAQATGPLAHDHWEEVVAHLAPQAEFTVSALEYGYRVPREVMDVARLAAEAAAVGDLVPKPVRESGEVPEFRRVASGVLLRSAVEVVRSHLEKGRSVGLIAPLKKFDEMAHALDYEQVQWTDGRVSLSAGLVLVPAEDSKGLEFDAVVVVEPSLIAGKDPRGSNLLYVAMTRTTRFLSIVYSEPLPEYLAGIHSGHLGTSVTESAAEPTPDEAEQSTVGTVGDMKPIAVSDEADEIRAAVIKVIVDRLERIVRGELPPTHWRDVAEELLRRLGL